MAWIAIVLKLIPAVIKLMKIAEQAFDDVPDSGAEKKEMVIQAIKAIVEGLSGITLTPEMWGKIESTISAIIDIACIFLFPKEAKK